MSTLETAKKNYIKTGQEILKATESLSAQSYGILEIITKSKLRKGKEKLTGYYLLLKEYDDVYTSELEINGTTFDIELKLARLKICESARLIFTSSLGGYERELSNIESSINFKLTTGIAMIALVFSLAGVLLA